MSAGRFVTLVRLGRREGRHQEKPSELGHFCLPPGWQKAEPWHRSGVEVVSGPHRGFARAPQQRVPLPS